MKVISIVEYFFSFSEPNSKFGIRKSCIETDKTNFTTSINFPFANRSAINRQPRNSRDGSSISNYPDSRRCGRIYHSSCHSRSPGGQDVPLARGVVIVRVKSIHRADTCHLSSIEIHYLISLNPVFQPFQPFFFSLSFPFIASLLISCLVLVVSCRSPRGNERNNTVEGQAVAARNQRWRCASKGRGRAALSGREQSAYNYVKRIEESQAKGRKGVPFAESSSKGSKRTISARWPASTGPNDASRF